MISETGTSVTVAMEQTFRVERILRANVSDSRSALLPVQRQQVDSSMLRRHIDCSLRPGAKRAAPCYCLLEMTAINNRDNQPNTSENRDRPSSLLGVCQIPRE